MIGTKDLWTDPITVRRIRRIQKSRDAGNDGLVSSPARESMPNRATSVASDSGEDIDEIERRTQALKRERSSPRRMPSQVIDLGGGTQASGPHDEDEDETE